MEYRSRGARLTRWNGRSKCTSETDCCSSVIWIWRIGCAVLFCSAKRPVPEKERRSGIDVDVRVDGDDLGLRQVFVFLEVAFVVGLDVAAILGGQIFVQHVRVVVVPGAAADGGQQEERGRGSQSRARAHCAGGYGTRSESSAPRRARRWRATPSSERWRASR